MPRTTDNSAVPLCDLERLHAPLETEIRAAIDEVLLSNAFINGPQVRELEGRVAEYCGCRHGIGCSSGTDALLLALMALDIGPGDEVVTTPLTFFATVGSIVRLGARPVFVDIDPATFNLDASQLAAAVTNRTRAIVPVHLFGQMCEMDPILEIAGRHEIPVIEDAAQAIGAEEHGRRACSLGTFGCLSFFPSKNLGGLGDGGMVLTSDASLAERVRCLARHGAERKYHHRLVGGNFRLDTIQAAVLLVKLARLDEWNNARRAAAARYRELISASPAARDIILPAEAAGRRHVYNQFVVRIPDDRGGADGFGGPSHRIAAGRFGDPFNRSGTGEFGRPSWLRRDELASRLKSRGISTAVYYPLPLHLQECFRRLGYVEGDFPQTERACREVLALPVSPAVTAEQQQRVVANLSEDIAATRFGRRARMGSGLQDFNYRRRAG